MRGPDIRFVCGDQEFANAAEQLERIAKLEIAMNALEGAPDRRENAIVH